MAATFPQIGLGDLLGLCGRFGGAFLRAPFRVDKGRVAAEWMRDVRRKRGSDDLVVNLLVKKILLVNGPALSKFVLSHEPSEEGFLEGKLKKDGMSFLAPNALTVQHGEPWYRLRKLNETALWGIEEARIRSAVETAFAKLPSSADELRFGMGVVMRQIVFSDGPCSPTASEDVQALFGYVENPVKRVLLGWTQKSRRARFYAGLATAVANPSNSLVARAVAARPPDTPDEVFLQQIPHWMFTFTGSATQWLTTTLALVGSRPAARDDAALKACLYEAARLYPPVSKTFHQCPYGSSFENREIATNLEIAHYFPFMTREGEEPDLQGFRPERWLEDFEAMHARFPNTFLSGPRTCPGRELISAVCLHALKVLTQRGLTVSHPSLASDPLPYSFPDGLRFSVRPV